MKRMTVGELKEILKNVPDDALLCCQSDSEGNETSTCLDVFIDKIGRRERITPEYSYVVGEDIQGINTLTDMDKVVVIFQPSL